MHLLLALFACTPPDDPVPTEDASAASIDAYDPLPYVDPIIATGGVGAQIANFNPGPAMPFGMTHVGPDTRNTYGAPGFYHCAGYHYEDIYIGGFSHTHAQGMGVPDYGGITVMPTDGWTDDFTTPRGRQVEFSHDDEDASPGYYRVRMENGVEVELTATLRGGHHRITFPAGAEPVLIFDMGAALGELSVSEGWVEVDGSHVTGFQRMQGAYSSRFGGLMTWFAADVDVVPESTGGWNAPDSVESGLTSVAGAEVGTWLRFPDGTTEVNLTVALSYVDEDGAEANLAAELPDTDFDSRRADAEQAWRDELSSVRIRTDDDDVMTIFHSALYRAYIWPSLFQDVDGRYRGFDQAIHSDPGHAYYSDFSLWDTYRTQHPWLILARPERNLDMVRSMARMTEDGGTVPRWPLGHGYTGGMIGSPAAMLFAETWLKGDTDFDAEMLYTRSVEQATGPVPNAGRGGIDAYVNGYVTFESSGQPASRTMEYAWADHSLAIWGDELGRSEADRMRTQSGYWKNTWDPDQRWFVGRYADGTFATVESPMEWVESYVEGNAWHYLYGIPFDVPGMVELQYGDDESAWLADLDQLWSNIQQEPDDDLPDDYYWHGNEPDLHYAYLGSLSGHRDHSAVPARWVMANRYGVGPDGLDGNDDGGTLSAWYLFSALGVYPIAGTEVYAFGSPLVERAEIDRPDGSTVIVRAPGVSDEAVYIDRVTAGGDAVDGGILLHDQLMAGELILEMTE